jgi:hypothetical protein
VGFSSVELNEGALLPSVQEGKVRDTTAPGDVGSLTATPGDGQVSLTWFCPTDADCAGVQIVRKIGAYPTSRTDGTCVYSGTDTRTTDTGLTNGTTYYYRAFSYDGVPNYSVGALASAVPQVFDTMGPALAITFPVEGAMVSFSESLTLMGTACDGERGGHGVSLVTVNGVNVAGTAAGADSATWSSAITLTPGVNTIVVVAKDALNNTNEQRIQVGYRPVLRAALRMMPSDGAGTAALRDIAPAVGAIVAAGTDGGETPLTPGAGGVSVDSLSPAAAGSGLLAAGGGGLGGDDTKRVVVGGDVAACRVVAAGVPLGTVWAGATRMTALRLGVEDDWGNWVKVDRGGVAVRIKGRDILKGTLGRSVINGRAATNKRAPRLTLRVSQTAALGGTYTVKAGDSSLGLVGTIGLTVDF